MTTFEVQVVKDTARPAASALAERARNPMPGLNIAGRALSNLLKAHYRQKGQTPNKLGGERQFFWLQVGQGVNQRQTGTNSVAVSIAHPAINQKIFGGTISAKRAGALTIPVHPQAYGRSASVLSKLIGVALFRVKDVLAGWDKSAKKLTIYYVLKKSVNQKPDPTALPPTSEMERVVFESWNNWMSGRAQGA